MDFSVHGTPGIGAVVNGRSDVSSMCYHENGKRLYVASATGNHLQIIDCEAGKEVYPALKCEREKIHTVEATHHEETVLFAGVGSPTQPAGQRYAVNYWSLYDNKILRKFRGHSEKVTGISMCPADDTFLTSSLDKTVRLWTAGQAGCLAEVKLPSETQGSPIAAFDATGLVFAISAAMSDGKGYYVHLYDARNFSAGAFSEMKISQQDVEVALQNHTKETPDRAKKLSQAAWTSLVFNVSGNQILIGADNGMCLLLDGFEGAVQGILMETKQTERSAVVCYTPDDNMALQANMDGSISCWNVKTGLAEQNLVGHSSAIHAIAANPKYSQISSACSQTALWTW